MRLGRVPSELAISYIDLGKFDHDLTATEPWNHGFYMGNHPQMAARFRLVKYYNLPRLIWLFLFFVAFCFADNGSIVSGLSCSFFLNCPVSHWHDRLTRIRAVAVVAPNLCPMYPMLIPCWSVCGNIPNGHKWTATLLLVPSLLLLSTETIIYIYRYY